MFANYTRSNNITGVKPGLKPDTERKRWKYIRTIFLIILILQLKVDSVCCNLMNGGMKVTLAEFQDWFPYYLLNDLNFNFVPHNCIIIFF